MTHIPASLVPRVRKLVDNGRRLEKLETEYARIVTDESLAALKKNGRRRLTLPRPPYRGSP